MHCVILCGGLGTRLGQYAGIFLKPMALIGGRPVIEHQIDLARQAGVHDIVLITGHQADTIEAYFGDGSRFGVNVHSFREPRPLGTTGGIKAVQDRLTDDFLVLYGDVMMCFDIARLVRFHREHQALASLVVHANEHPYDSDLVELDDSARIVAFHAKPHPPSRYYANLVNAGAYLLSPGMLPHLEAGVKADFGRDIFPRLVPTRRLYGYNTPEYLKDIGIPERYDRVNADWASGKIQRMHLRNPRPAIYLDRDGVLNHHVNNLAHPDQFELLPGVARTIRRINQSEHLALVVTNQPAIAKGMTTFEQVVEVHRKLESLLGEQHAKLDAIAFCPHHPDRGFPGEIAELKGPCECRKPATGMICRLAEKYHVDLANSFLIGDSGRDLECAVAAGMTPIGVRTGLGCCDMASEPPFLFDDLEEAVTFLLDDPLRAVAEAVRTSLPRAAGGPSIIVVDGSTRSGKTILAAYLGRDLARHGRRIVRLAVEGLSAVIEDPDRNVDTVIVEGRPDHAAAVLARPVDLYIQTDIDEAQQAGRLERHARWKGLTANEIVDFIRSREHGDQTRWAAGAAVEADLHVFAGRLRQP